MSILETTGKINSVIENYRNLTDVDNRCGYFFKKAINPHSVYTKAI